MAIMKGFLYNVSKNNGVVLHDPVVKEQNQFILHTKISFQIASQLHLVALDYFKQIRRRGYRRKGKLMTTENYHLQQSLIPFLGMRFNCRGFEKKFLCK